jgi:hypothetical protein
MVEKQRKVFLLEVQVNISTLSKMERKERAFERSCVVITLLEDIHLIALYFIIRSSVYPFHYEHHIISGLGKWQLHNTGPQKFQKARGKECASKYILLPNTIVLIFSCEIHGFSIILDEILQKLI